jgi:hypothetical protein
MSTTQYFILLAAILAVPLIYVVISAVEFYPTADHFQLLDQNAADMLGVANSNQIILTGWVSFDVRTSLCFLENCFLM